ncbi:STAS domain-containing protein [Actinoallomurus sp. NPDC052308]|uniref:STAS domain-containing protein n=1 Tax=Actinoallomurus sp. NPDC052308 TaxID=3155530 RepID=UPI003446FC7F
MVKDLDVDVIDVSGPIAVLTVKGELNLYTSGGFRTAVRGAGGDGHPHLILDVSGVPFCDSSGLSALIMLHRWAGEAGGSLTLAAVPDRMSRLLEMSGVDQTIPIQRTVGEALEQHPHGGDRTSAPQN